LPEGQVPLTQSDEGIEDFAHVEGSVPGT
jgi:hypothetical protein